MTKKCAVCGCPYVGASCPNCGSKRSGRGGLTMREILFRGKTTKDKEWVYGDLLHDGYDYDVAIWEKEHKLVTEVSIETIGQFTGLTDKNGKKIFEGDIVDCWSEGVNAKGTVQQRKDGLWIIYPAWQKTIMWGLCPDEYCHTTVEVIGNIHDNPELLGGERKEGE